MGQARQRDPEATLTNKGCGRERTLGAITKKEGSKAKAGTKPDHARFLMSDKIIVEGKIAVVGADAKEPVGLVMPPEILLQKHQRVPPGRFGKFVRHKRRFSICQGVCGVKSGRRRHQEKGGAKLELFSHQNSGNQRNILTFSMHALV
jgi:hypothetical protein